MASIGPQEASSNLAEWFEMLGLESWSSSFTPATDTSVAWVAGIGLVLTFVVPWLWKRRSHLHAINFWGTSVEKKSAVISDIGEILSLVNKVETDASDHIARSRLQILVSRFEELDLLPPAKQIPFNMHFGRLLPLVEEYGINKARKEMVKWYARAAKAVLEQRRGKVT